MNKKRSTLLNMIIMTIYQVITVAVGFIVPKLLLSTYGAEIHGYTSTVSTIMSYIALLNAGLASAGLQSLYAPLSKKDSIEISRTLKAIDRMYVKTGVLYSIAVLTCALVLPCVISSEIQSVYIFGIMLVMGASNTMECFIYSKYRVLLQADQKLYVVTIADIAALIIRCILQVILINNKASILFVQAVPLLLVFLRMLILWAYSKKYYKIDNTVEPNYNALSKRKSAFIHQIAALVVNNTDTVILTFVGSLVQVSIYSVYNLICSHINTLFSYIFQQSVVASFGHLISGNKIERLKKVFSVYEFIYTLIITVIFSSTANLLYPFVTLYTSSIEDVQYADVLLTILFVAVGIANNLRIPCLMIINAAGMFKETQNRAVIEAVLNISISMILVFRIGIYGLLAGTIISFLYRTTDIIVFTNRKILHQCPKTSILRSIKVVFLVILNVIIFGLLYRNQTIDSWTNWLVAGVVSTLISLIITVAIDLLTEKNECRLLFNQLIIFVRKNNKKGMP